MMSVAKADKYALPKNKEGWKPTRSPEREVELELGDVEQMLAAQNRHRRRRGAPERTLADVSRAAERWTSSL